MTTDELRETLKSKPVKLGLKLQELIKNKAPVAEIEALLEKGAAVRFPQRHPRNPRKQFVWVNLIDDAFSIDSDPRDFILVTSLGNEEKDRAAQKAAIAARGEGPDNRIAIFKAILRHTKDERGSNGWRGDLFKFIVSRAFTEELHPDLAFKYAQIITTEFDFADGTSFIPYRSVSEWAVHSYDWHSERGFEIFLRLGGDPRTAELSKMPIRHLNCADSRYSSTLSRLKVLKKLAAAGAEIDVNSMESVYGTVHWERREDPVVGKYTKADCDVIFEEIKDLLAVVVA
jgi:hypothetical protein